jgi:hypothetical protein
MTWRVRVNCGSSRAALAIRVQGDPRAGQLGLIRGRVRTGQHGTRFREPGIEAPAPTTEAAVLSAPLMLPSGAVMFPLSGGQCTAWAYAKRPDVFDNRAPTDTNTDWNADTWVAHAQAEGLVVDGTPRVGDIAAWPQSFGPPGHVSYVEAVEGSGSITISEMNTSGLPPGDYHSDPEGHTYEVETLEEPAGLGLEFIHSR